MTKSMPLSRGLIAIVDDEDFESLSKHKWSAAKANGGFYASRSEGGRSIRMHNQIMNPPKGLFVDHINGDTLNNTRSNLRVCTREQNQMNRRAQSNNKSGFKGVSWHEAGKKWQACVRVNYKTMYLGLFKDKESAARAHDEAAEKYFGEFARTNKAMGLLKEQQS